LGPWILWIVRKALLKCAMNDRFSLSSKGILSENCPTDENESVQSNSYADMYVSKNISTNFALNELI